MVNPRQALRDVAELATPVAETLDGLDTLLASTQFAALFCRAPLTHSDAAVAFVGLDSRVCDSGQKPGRRCLSKRGPSELRRLLYNCAQAAAKTATWKPYYTTLRAREFSATQALVILAKKLLRIAFSLWRQENAKFDAQKIGCLRNVI